MPISKTLLRRCFLPGQFIHLVGSVGWNVAGVFLIARNHQPLGPTASLELAAVLLLVGVGLWIGYVRLRYLYIAISLFLGVGALSTFIQAFVGEASNWPSAFWRWSGATLNFVGFVANFSGITIAFCQRGPLNKIK